MVTIVWWIRRDLRLADNAALYNAIMTARQMGGDLLPLFILDPELLSRPAPARQAFLLGGLQQLDAALRQRGSRLTLRRGTPIEVLSSLAQEVVIQGIFAGEDYSPYALQRDRGVAAVLPLHLFPGVTIPHPAAVLKADGSPYTVFTPFARAWKAEAGSESLLPVPVSCPPVPDLPSENLPLISSPDGFPPGEAEAQRRLQAFCSGPILAYAGERNRLDLPGTAVLSPYLRFGMLSPRQALAAAREARPLAAPGSGGEISIDTWINELIWRDFYVSILYYFPAVLRQAFNPALRSIPWRDAPADLRAWQSGLTGFPVVDAAMRQLSQTGWMHNRARMLTASFLVKDLLINWQAGEAWFMRHLVDGDPAANNGGWQWTAGVGTDAAPYFRIFNPILQGEKFDPDGSYVRRWVPELATLPDRFIHHPWDMPADVSRGLGFAPGQTYPLPLVDRSQSRPRALAAYRRT